MWLRELYNTHKRKRLHNKDFTIISNNCCGGMMYHDLKQKFLSPTINLSFPPNDYLLFVEHLDDALNQAMTEDCHNDANYPVGFITLSTGETIHINFMHYHTYSEAQKKWEERCKRVKKNNLFIFMEMGQSTSDELFDRFLSLPYKNKFAITNKQYNSKYAQMIDIYDNDFFGESC